MMKRLLIGCSLLVLCGFTSGGGGLVGGGTYMATSDISPTNWATSTGVSASWRLEEASGASATDDSDNDDTLTNNGTVGTDTGIEGSGARDLLSPSNYLSCADGNCPDVEPCSGTGCYFSFGAWLYPQTTDATADNVMQKFSGTNSTGYSLRHQPDTLNEFRCQIESAAGDLIRDTDTDEGAGAWYFMVCTVSDTGDMNLCIHKNGGQVGCQSATRDYGTDASEFRLGNSAGTYDGLMDLAFVDDNAAWSAAESARVCSINIRGDLGKCDPDDATLYKGCDNNSDCGGTAVCDTGAGAIDDTYCTADTTGTKCSGSTCDGCCMGRNSTSCGGNQLTACNAAEPSGAP